jgi:hypothetical protein
MASSFSRMSIYADEMRRIAVQCSSSSEETSWNPGSLRDEWIMERFVKIMGVSKLFFYNPMNFSNAKAEHCSPVGSEENHSDRHQFPHPQISTLDSRSDAPQLTCDADIHL